jgi:hypothetical protein
LNRERAPEDLRAIYALLVDPLATTYQGVHAEPAELAVADLRRRLRAAFAADSAVPNLLLVVAGVEIGITSPERCREVGYAGSADGPEAGGADRATLPGLSTRYRVVEFRCLPPCQRSAVAAFYDERLVPRCAEHGPMELVR